jgi:hypothetical protein
MIIRPILFAAFAIVGLSACQETPTETAKDVSQAQETAVQDNQEARQEANQDRAQAEVKVIEAKDDMAAVDTNAMKKITEAESEAMTVAAKAKYDVAMTEAQGRHNIEAEKCDALKDQAKDSCVSTNNATLAADQARIIATHDAEILAATYVK